jgi:hypothetical protein
VEKGNRVLKVLEELERAGLDDEHTTKSS